MENSNNNKKDGMKTVFIAVIVVLALTICAYLLINSTIEKDTPPVKSEEKSDAVNNVLKEGGILIIFAPDVENPKNVSAKDMETAKFLIRSRLDMNGYPEAVIEGDDSNKITVAIPGISVSQEVAEKISAIGKLEFIDADGNIIMDGSSKYIINSEPQLGETSEHGGSQYYVQINFTKEGQQKFKEATAAAVQADGDKQYISIALDGIVQMSPRVNEVIDSESCIITGNYTQSDAENVSNLINSAKLPFSLITVEMNAISPQQ